MDSLSYIIYTLLFLKMKFKKFDIIRDLHSLNGSSIKNYYLVIDVSGNFAHYLFSDGSQGWHPITSIDVLVTTIFREEE